MSFHLFDIAEVYSNDDGSIQFIELVALSGGQQFLDHHTIVVSATNTFEFENNLPGDTAGKRFIIATQGFADFGFVTPDYIVPDGFVLLGNGTINFGENSDVVGYTNLPTMGGQSLNRGNDTLLGDEGGEIALATPRNFAGQTITINSTLAPVLMDPIEDLIVGNGDGLNLVLSAGTFADITGDALTYGAELANDDPLPAWLIFTPGTRTFSFAAGTGVPGTYDIEVTANDTAGGSASDTFVLQVISGDVVTGTGGPDSLTGTANDDVISGLAGDDTIDSGGGGNDTITGGAGTDTLRSSTSVALPADIENLVFTGVGDLEGVGNGLANLMIGNSGNNEFDGAGGNDSLYGEGGNDTFTVDAGDTVVEGESGGIDLVLTSVQIGALFDEVENLTLLAGNFSLTGNALSNTLTGSDGNNVLNGGAEGDQMIGGLGNDTYQVDHAGDTVSETGVGTDLVQSSVSFSLAVGSDVLAGDVERLTLTGGGNIDGTGNALANLITGNAGHNVLDGAGGDDSINGGVGDDTLDGSAGSDTLKGGTGADVFLFEDAAGSDKLSDFTTGVDEIWLDNETFSALADGPLGAGNAQFALRGAISESSGDGDDYVKYATDTGELYYDSNGSAAGGLSLIAVIDPSCGATLPQLALVDIVVV